MNALPTVTVDGRTVGTWNSTVRRSLRLKVGQLVPLKSGLKPRILEDGHKIGEFLMTDARVEVSVRPVCWAPRQVIG